MKLSVTLGKYGSWPFKRTLKLDEQKLQQHFHVMGKTGQGKSVLLEKIASDLIMAGVPVSVIDPHSDLVHNILRHLYEQGYFNRPDAYKTLWYVDLGRRDYSIPWNVLRQTNGKGEQIPLDAIASNMKDVVKRAFPALAGGAAPVFENILQHSAVALAANGLPLTAIELLLTNKPFREKLLANCSHFPTVSFFHNRFDRWDKRKQAEDIESTLNKISIISLSQPLLNSISQRENYLDFRQIIDQGTSVLYDLGSLNADARKLAGCFLSSGYEQSALARSDMHISERRQHQFIIDEFSSFVTAESLSTIFSEARKYKFSLTIANQTLAQLTEELRSATQNVGINIFFRLGYDDAVWAAPRIGHANPFHKKHEPKALKGELTVEGNPVYFQLQEEYEAWIKKIEGLRKRQAYVKFDRNLPWWLAWLFPTTKTVRIKVVNVPSQTCKNEDLQEIKEKYAQILMKPTEQVKDKLNTDKDLTYPQTEGIVPVRKRRNLVSST